MIDPNARNVIQPLVERAHRAPQQRLVTFIKEDGSAIELLAGPFHADCLAYARALRELGIGRGDLVILVLKHSTELLSAFWGCLYLGSIASVFPFLTEKLDPQIYQQRVKTLVGLSKAKAVITFPEFKQDLTELLADAGCRVLSIDEVPLDRSGHINESIIVDTPSDRIAFLQHSSGTTGLQKGVALSHRSVLNHITALSTAVQLNKEDSIISWLPLYHDMGLIGALVMPLVFGIPLILISPFHWVRDPAVFFQAAVKYKGTIGWIPNFAFNHSVRGIRSCDMEGLDLSHFRLLINCSEPVRLDSFRLFLEHFEKYGITADRLGASYGMAETTFIATQTVPGVFPRVDWVKTSALQLDKVAVPAQAETPGASPMVSCGPPIPHVEMKVVDPQDPDDKPLPIRHVGEIVLRSNCLFDGYYHRPDLSAETLKNGWFHSGDFGYTDGEEWYISGRKKDLIIVGGKNIFPQDLEAIANNTPGLYPGRNVAFGVNDPNLGSEGIVLACELQDDNCSPEDRQSISRDLRKRVVQQMEATLSDVYLVGHKWLIKTSSGKIARSANREKYLEEIRKKKS
ncbi:MAG: AMP-binding protein [Anaerolineaceae bacterium]